jgi:membrane protein DedA with SNARE-associated domain/rhodanese-related sulfurtransferase
MDPLFSEASLAWLVAANTFVHEAGIPLPMMPTVLLAGARADAGQANALLLVMIVSAATLAGNAVWYVAGRLFGGRVLKMLCRVSLSPDTCVGRTETAFTRWGSWSLVVGHFVPGVSLVAPPLAGALGMSWWTFTALTALGGAFYGAVVIGAGMLLGSAILELTDFLSQNGERSVAFVLVAIAGYVAWKWWRRRSVAAALDAPRMSVADLRSAMAGENPPIVLDVRGAATREADPRVVPGALGTTIEGAVADVPADAQAMTIVVYCACPRDASAAMAASALIAAGYRNAFALRGGLDAWFDA